MLTTSFGFPLFQSPKHLQVPQVHFEDTRAKPQFRHRETIAPPLVIVEYVVNEEDLGVAQSGR